MSSFRFEFCLDSRPEGPVIPDRAACVGSVASEPVACSLVILVAELALVVEVAEFLELVRLLGRGEVGGGLAWSSFVRMQIL